VLELPDFPWDSLRDHKRRAAAHPEGMIDLSVGSPVDDTVPAAALGLSEATNAPGYPLTSGSPELVSAMVSWWQTQRSASAIAADNVLPVIGSKETVALLPLLLGMGQGDAVVHPSISYPTYEVGALVCGAEAVRADTPDDWPDNTRLVWINSPSNPTGEVLGLQALRVVVGEARRRGIVVASDECYGLLGSENQPVAPSILDDRVTDAPYTGVVALHSLSKQANMAGYRAAFMAGDADIIGQVLQARRHLGLMVPTPIQSAVARALADTDSVATQRSRYARRRLVIRAAFEAAGFSVEHSEAGLYVWATRGESADDSVGWCARRGVLVTPGYFYGDSSSQHIRVALTVTDAEADAVSQRLQSDIGDSTQ
jgi:succinyldiaminopimelate transaminase